ncbi:hypothetical protein BV898_08351 [Hypsibius exemplaris]|uniref:G-protein coupled receptors family 1 profile domain-containing protein n=1 Tax=Hypsibius exemplaris TaxID=2072580 RepID=A0A1W0WQU9_HYPEX|nr:hypothetical protein BV898_08351 [Hypsibius exemplaris]
MNVLNNSSYGNFSLILTNTSSDDGNGTNDVRLDHCGWPEEEEPDIPGIEYLDMVTYPFLLALSTVGNVLNVFVLSCERPQTSKNIYLLALAYSDVCYMWAQFLPYLRDRESDPSELFRRVLEAAMGVILFLQENAAFVSDWIIVAFSIDRFVAISAPLHYRVTNSVGRSVAISVGIVTVATAHTSLRLSDYYFWYTHYSKTDSRPVRPVALQRWKDFYMWTLSVLPSMTFLVILSLNASLMYIIIRQRRTRFQKLSTQLSDQSAQRAAAIPGGDPVVSGKHSENYMASIMLATCVLLYLITQTPSAVLMVLETLKQHCIRRHSKVEESLTEPIKLFFLNLNFSLNFVLYCAVNPVFRAALRKHLRRHCGRPYKPGESLRTTKTSLRSKSSSNSAAAAPLQETPCSLLSYTNSPSTPGCIRPIASAESRL